MVKEEKWKEITGFNGAYQISDHGRVKNIKSGRILKPHVNNRGYQLIWLQQGGKENKKRYSIHRLVALYFLPPALATQEVHHLDGNNKNNLATNLEWVSHYQNIMAAFSSRDKVGTKITHLPTGKVYNSISHAARDLKCSMVNISMQLRGLRNNKLDVAYIDV
jgi:hypothetical protein